jgi:hypothetical protein
MLYFDHRSAVGNIGKYIRDELAPAVRAESDWSDAIGWEDAIRRLMSSRGRFRQSAFQFDIPILFAFLLIPAVITAYMATQLTATWLWLAWSVGLLAEILTAAAGLQAARNWHTKPKKLA